MAVTPVSRDWLPVAAYRFAPTIGTTLFASVELYSGALHANGTHHQGDGSFEVEASSMAHTSRKASLCTSSTTRNSTPYCKPFL